MEKDAKNTNVLQSKSLILINPLSDIEVDNDTMDADFLIRPARRTIELALPFEPISDKF